MVRSLVLHADERRRAVETARRLADLPTVFRPVGGVVAATRDEGQWDEAIADLRSLGWPVDHRRSEDAASVLRGSAARHSVVTPLDGVCDAPLLVRWLLRDVHVQPEPQGDVDLTVVATGAWAVLEGVGLVATRRHLIRTQPHPLAQGPWVWIEGAGVYLRPEGGRFLTSACDEVEGDPTPPRGTPDAAEVLRAVAEVARWFPAVGQVEVADARWGLRTFCADRRARVGPDPLRPDLWWCVGLGGSGVSTALAIGEELAAQITGVPAKGAR